MMQLFYVDRVRFKSTTVGRKYPICLNWDNKSLKEREKQEIKAGGFGQGSVMEPINSIVEEIPVVSTETEESLRDNAQICKEELIADATEMAAKFIQFVTKLGKAPIDIFGDAKFRNAMENANKVIGYDISEKLKEYDAQPSQKTPSQIEDAYWDRPDVIKSIEELDRALSTRYEYMEMEFSAPSFDIGFPQTPEDAAQEDEDNDQLGEKFQNLEHENVQMSEEIDEENEDDENVNEVIMKIAEEVEEEAIAAENEAREGDGDEVEKEVEKETREAGNDEDEQNKKDDEGTDKGKGIQVGPKTRKGTKKMVESMLSPYKIRTINPNENLITSESTLAYYALHNEDDNK